MLGGASLSYFHQGPLPPPEELARFNDVDPSFAERIMRMAELDVRTRSHEIVEMVDAEARAVNASAAMVVVVPVGLLAIAVVAMIMGWPWPVSVLAFIAPILTAIAHLVSASREKRGPS